LKADAIVSASWLGGALESDPVPLQAAATDSTAAQHPTTILFIATSSSGFVLLTRYTAATPIVHVAKLDY
jgi:hypothetical protein